MDLTGIDEAIQESIPTNDELDLEGAEPEGEPEGKEEESKEKKPKEDDKEGETKTEKDGIEGYDDSEKDEKPEGDEKKEGEEEEESEPEDNEPPVKKPKKNRYWERINNITRERNEARDRLAELEEQINSKPPELPPEPNPADYRFDKNKQGDYERASAQYHQDVGKWQAEVERIKDAHENRSTHKVDQEKATYHEKMANDTSVYGDYATANRTLANVPLSAEIHDALVHDEHNTDLFCFLGNPKNSKYLDMVQSAKGYRQAKLLTEISFKLQYHKNNAKRKTSKNPPPTGKPKGGKSVGGSGKNLDKSSFEDYSKAMSKAQRKLNKQWVT